MKLEKVRMKTIFKKSLVAAALAAAAFNASAVTVTATAAAISQEGAANQTSIVVPNVLATAGAEYTVGDTITLTFSGAELDLDASVPAMTVAFTDNDAATIGFVGATATSVTFRITAQTDGNADAGVNYSGDAVFTATGLRFKTSTVVDAVGAIKVTHSAANVTGSIVIDNLGTKEATVANVIAQFSSSVTTKLDGVIDVGQSRQKFVGATTDVLVVTPVEAAAATHDAAYVSTTHVIKGDFSFADANKNGTVTTAELNAAVAVATAGTGDTIAQPTLNTALNELTVVVTEAGAANTPAATTFTFTEPGVATTKPVLVPGSYTATTTIRYTPATGAAANKTTESNAAAGAWTLNGATVQVPYLVFGTVGGKAYNTIVQLNNSSTVAGDVFVDVFKEDGTQVLANKKVGTAAAQSTTNLGGAIKAELEALGASNSKVSVKVVANVPEDKAAVYSAFVDTVTGERIIINNDSKVQTK